MKIAAIILCYACVCLNVNADSQAPGAKPMTENLTYLHLYTDPDGMTHFREESIEFNQVDEPGARPSLSYHEITGAKSASLVKLKKGAVEDWHTAPRKQFSIVVQGIVELTAGDGEVRRLTPGSVTLLADTTGKGHITAAVGDQDHIALMIPIEATQ